MIKIKFYFLFSLFAILINAKALATQKEIENLTKFISDWGYLENYHPLLYSNTIDNDSLYCIYADRILLNSFKYTTRNLLTDLRIQYETIYPDLGVRKIIPINFNSDLEDIIRQKGIKSDLINKRVTYNNLTHQLSIAGSKINTSFFPNASLRTLAISKIWNNYKFYYPYRYILPKNGSDLKLLSRYIKKVRDCKNVTEYHMLILEFTSQYPDSHSCASSFVLKNKLSKKTIPLKVRWVQNNIMIVNYYAEELVRNSLLIPGDCVLQINGEKTKDVFKRLIPYTAYSNKASLYRDLCDQALRTDLDSIRLLINRSGHLFEVTIPTFNIIYLKTLEEENKKAIEIKEIKDSILYVNCQIIDTLLLRNTLQNNRHIKGFVFDLRSTTKWIKPIIEDFFFKTDTTFATYNYPLPSSPGHFSDPQPLLIGPGDPGYYFENALVAILVNEDTQSQGEFQSMFLQAIPKSFTIGSKTAGTDGNIAEFIVPGNITISMTSLAIQYPTGKRTQKNGIKIDYYVNPDKKAIILGIDQELSLATELINKGG